jgi:sugar phosphate isomerase/epimerase
MNAYLSISPSLNRREFMKRATLGVATATLAAELVPAVLAADKKIPVGVQLYSVRDQCKTDLPGTLAQVSKIGYKGVEFAGYYDRSAKELRKMLDDNGLIACGTHTPFETIQPKNLDATMEFNQTIGNKFLIVPWMNETNSKKEWMDRAELFNQTADKVKPHGMAVGYHAHAHDFKTVGGVTAWDLFFGNTSREVIMQLDTSNCMDGGQDPVLILKKYPGRVRTIHIKSHGAGPEAVIGEDKINWKEVFAFCEGPGKTDWYVLEHETSKDPIDAIRRSYAALQKFGKV